MWWNFLLWIKIFSIFAYYYPIICIEWINILLSVIYSTLFCFLFFGLFFNVFLHYVLKTLKDLFFEALSVFLNYLKLHKNNFCFTKKRKIYTFEFFYWNFLFFFRCYYTFKSGAQTYLFNLTFDYLNTD